MPFNSVVAFRIVGRDDQVMASTAFKAIMSTSTFCMWVFIVLIKAARPLCVFIHMMHVWILHRLITHVTF